MATTPPDKKPAKPMRREAVIRDLRALAAKLQRPIEAADVRRRTRLVGAIAATFGDLSSALRAAGLPEVREDQLVIWGPERVLEAIRAIPSGAKVPLALGKHARRLFGTVAAARAAAGVEVLRKAWTDDEVIQAIQAHGSGQLTSVLIKASLRHFGSVNAARKAAGVASNRDTWDPARVLDELRRAPEGMLSESLYYACRKFFGSTAAAREAAMKTGPGRGHSPATRRDMERTVQAKHGE